MNIIGSPLGSPFGIIGSKKSSLLHKKVGLSPIFHHYNTPLMQACSGGGGTITPDNDPAPDDKPAETKPEPWVEPPTPPPYNTDCP